MKSRDQEAAEWLADRAGLPTIDQRSVWITAANECLAAARAEGEHAGYALAMQEKAPAPSSERDREMAADAARDVAEWPDRTSPDDYPDCLLITADEFVDLVSPLLAAARAEGGQAGYERGKAEAIEGLTITGNVAIELACQRGRREAMEECAKIADRQADYYEIQGNIDGVDAAETIVVAIRFALAELAEKQKTPSLA